MNTKIVILQKRIDHNFLNKSHILNALTHPSYLNENSSSELERDSYQRLEFLGDAVLEYLSSAYLFQKFPNYREGELTEIRAALVRTENLAKVANKLGLGECLFISKGEELNGGRDNQNILADCLEALIAALYLDGKLKTAESFFSKFVLPELEEILSKKLYVDNKTELQEHLQARHKQTPVYRQIKVESKNGQQIFTIGVYLGQKCLGVGVGKNKRLAQQAAAKNALGKIKQF
jgi:ribonuclease III